MTTNDSIPTPRVKHAPRWLLPSLIWVIPIVAALVGLSLVVQSTMLRGPTITISFVSAEGIEADRTKIRFKSIEIGQVKSAKLSSDRKTVIVSAELAKEAEGFASADSRFWVVRPRFSPGNVSGLGTLLSGSYISVDGGESDVKQTKFVGLEEPPLVQSGTPGKRFVLEAQDAGSLDATTPIFFHRFVVGHIESVTLNPDGRKVTISAWVNAPYDKYVMENTRFWQASGIDLRLDSSGVKLNTQSMSSILLGGIAFGTPEDEPTGNEAQQESTFKLASSMDEAFKKTDGEQEEVFMDFYQSVRGLSVGATIDFRGIELGEVTSIGMVFNREKRTLAVRVGGKLFFSRMHDAGVDETRDSKQRRVIAADLMRHGLRAQLRSGNLLTGQLYVALDFFPDAAPVSIDSDMKVALIPTIPGDLDEIQKKASDIMDKVNRIPFDEIGQSVQKTLVALESALKSFETLAGRMDKDLEPEVRKTLAETRRTMQSLQSSVAPDSPLQQDVRQTMKTVIDAARSVKSLADFLDRNPESLIRGRREVDTR